jgi:hypothetical protein
MRSGAAKGASMTQISPSDVKNAKNGPPEPKIGQKHGWTVPEATKWLHPPLPERQVYRLVCEMAPLGYRRGKRGRPVAVYDMAATMLAHAERVIGVAQNADPPPM